MKIVHEECFKTFNAFEFSVKLQWNPFSVNTFFFRLSQQKY